MKVMLCLIRILFCFGLFFLSGCIAGRAYRSNIPAEEVMPTPKWPGAASIAPGPPCRVKTAADFKGPCIAYIEFDDQGELRVAPGDIAPVAKDVEQTHCTPEGLPTTKSKANPSQVDFAKDLICSARNPAKNELTQPIVIIFVHGWKHNASEKPLEDANVQGLKDFLNVFRSHYPDTWIDATDGFACNPGTLNCMFLRHPVIGIYIAWRGDSVSHYFPVSRTFSVFDREATGYRVGNTSLTDALTEISAVTHPFNSDQDPYQPFLLMMGHSFGGLILERTLAQALMERLGDPANANSKSSLADLVVYVNTAVAATDSKQVIDLLARHEADEGNIHASSTDLADKRYPLIVSLSSVDDQATLSGLTVSHALPALGRKLMGSARGHVPMLCYEPETGQAGRIDDFSQTDFYMHTAPHFEAMQSHELKAIPMSQCVDHNAASDLKALIRLGAPRTGNQMSEWLRDSFGPTKMGNSCYAIVPKNSLLIPKQNAATINQRCNGTPYFVLEVPHDIIPDHGTIFTQRHLRLLTTFLPQARYSSGDPTSKQEGIISKRPLKAQ